MDLRSFLKSTFKVAWIEGELTIPSVSMNDYYALMEVDEMPNSKLKEKAKARDQLLLNILNRNTEEIKITKEEYLNLPSVYLNAIYNLIVNNAIGLLNDPN